jgi:hypothetical protein
MPNRKRQAPLDMLMTYPQAGKFSPVVAFILERIAVLRTCDLPFVRLELTARSYSGVNCPLEQVRSTKAARFL